MATRAVVGRGAAATHPATPSTTWGMCGRPRACLVGVAILTRMTSASELTIGGRHVATLTPTGGDFPWVHGRCTHGPDAAMMAPYLVAWPDGRQELDLDLLAAGGHGPETVLLDPETYLHTLVVAPDGSATWRIGVDPLDVGT